MSFGLGTAATDIGGKWSRLRRQNSRLESRYRRSTDTWQVAILGRAPEAADKPLLKLIEDGKIDPSFVVTHPASLEEAPAMYKKFRDKADSVIKVVLLPGC